MVHAIHSSVLHFQNICWNRKPGKQQRKHNAASQSQVCRQHARKRSRWQRAVDPPGHAPPSIEQGKVNSETLPVHHEHGAVVLKFQAGDTRVQNLLSNSDLYILPTMNPDGYANSKYKECHGTRGRYTKGKTQVPFLRCITNLPQSHQSRRPGSEQELP